MIVTVEGHSYSGKTVLLTHLSTTAHAEVIPEHDTYAGGIENYPPFPPKTEQMATHNVDFFADIERRRASDSKDKKSDVLYMDRSFVSVILFQKYMKHLNITGRTEAFEYATKLFANMAANEEIIVPDVFVYLTCASDELYMQRQAREISVSDLRGIKALHFFADEYEKIAKIYERYGRLCRLVSTNHRDSLITNTKKLDEISTLPALTRIEKGELSKQIIGAIA